MPAKRELQRLINFAKSKGVEVDGVTKRILQFFLIQNFSYFVPSMFGAITPKLTERLSKQLKLHAWEVEDVLAKLERVGLVGEERGISCIVRAKYYYGLTTKVRKSLKSSRKSVSCRRS